MRHTIGFLSDFGLDDSYVAEVKAVLLAHCPDAQILDITHLIPPQDVRWGAFNLWRAYSRFPEGALFLAVVDPGVGTKRRALHVSVGPYQFFGPDNGILVWAARDCEKRFSRTLHAREIPVPPGVGPTFHARDVFAPFLGRTLSGEAAPGHPVERLMGEPFPQPVRESTGELAGEILGFDRFGNAVTNLPIGPGLEVRVEGSGEPLCPAAAYAALPEGKAGLIQGSHGLWEISVRDGSARALLGLERGRRVSGRLLL